MSVEEKPEKPSPFAGPASRLFVAEPDLSGNEERYVVEAIRSTWISSTGAFVDRFEREFADLAGCATAIAVANGTVALHLALLCLEVGAGDEVIVPSLTYIATANAVRYTGAEPVFADVQEETWCVDSDAIEAAITPKTRGIIAVHLYGHPADMDAINAVAERHGLWVVEDAAEAPLATYRGRPVGSLSSMATFSFYGNKVFTSGEGGAVTTNDPVLAQRARLLRGQGMDPERRYFFPVVGYNYRLTNVACAMLCAQLERADEILGMRRSIVDRYDEALSPVSGINPQPTAEWAARSPWLYCSTVDEELAGIGRDELMDRLADRGIETRPFFIPIHTLPPYKDCRVHPREMTVTNRLADSGLNLPTHAGVGDAEIGRVVDAIRHSVGVPA